jgi:hypothetical protein
MLLFLIGLLNRMTYNRLFFLGLFTVGFIFLADAQQKDINFTSLTTKDGLSSNTVNRILKDRFG